MAQRTLEISKVIRLEVLSRVNSHFISYLQSALPGRLKSRHCLCQGAKMSKPASGHPVKLALASSLGQASRGKPHAPPPVAETPGSDPHHTAPGLSHLSANSAPEPVFWSHEGHPCPQGLLRPPRDGATSTYRRPHTLASSNEENKPS